MPCRASWRRSRESKWSLPKKQPAKPTPTCQSTSASAGGGPDLQPPRRCLAALPGGVRGSRSGLFQRSSRRSRRRLASRPAHPLAEDLIYNRREDALPRFLAAFEGVEVVSSKEAAGEADADLPVDQRIHQRILHRRKEGVEDLLDESIAQRQTPDVTRSEASVKVLNEVLLPAMKDVGDRFGAGELILPFVLQSAEVMKRSVAHLEQYLEKQAGYSKGSIVVATVYGDVHDIGKSLLITILSNNGYTVHDLGKQVPVNTIIEAAIEHQADAIGLSALLVSTSKQMPLCIEELDRRGLHLPVLIGGAAINRAFGRRAAVLPDKRVYEPAVFYCKDVFEGLSTMDALTNPAQRSDLVQQVR